MVLDDDPPVRIKHRFAAKRMLQVVNSLNETQKGFVIKHGFGNLLGIKSLTVPIPLVEWIMEHYVVGVSQFIHRGKCIKFTPSVVKDVFGIPSGSVPVDLETTDVSILRRVDEVKGRYLVDDKAPIKELIALTLADNDENSFMRSFMLVAISLVLCPSTQNYANLKYLNCLMDASKIKDYDWVGHIIDYMGSEVKKFQAAIDSHNQATPFSPMYVGSCLPLLAIVYMDFLDLDPTGCHHQICYSLPRICNVSSSDFSFVMSVDRNTHVEGRHVFGVIALRGISSSPYTVDDSADVGNNRSSIPLQASANIESGINQIVSRHQESFRNFVATSVVPAFLESLMPSLRNHISLMSADIYAHCLEMNQSSSSHGPSSNSDMHTPGPSCGGFGPSSFAQDIAMNESTPPVAVPAQTSFMNEAADINMTNPSGHGISSSALNISGHCSGRSAASIFASGALVNSANDIRNVFAAQDGFISGATAGINIAMSLGLQSNFSEQVLQHSGGSFSMLGAANLAPGSSTIQKKKRKKRHHVVFPDEPPRVKLSLTSEIQAFYHKYVCEDYISTRQDEESPTFLDFGGLKCSYADFRNCFKQDGPVSYDFMSIFVKIFNDDYRAVVETTSSRFKIAFSPYLVSKLVEDPLDYDPVSTEAELTRINAEFEMMKTDLFFFPYFMKDRWVLICVNQLYYTVNFFDPLPHFQLEEKHLLVSNLVTNFQRSCYSGRIFDRSIEGSKRDFPNSPLVLSEYDSGINVLLCMEHWDGKVLASFGTKEVSKFRKILAFKTVLSPLNNLRDPSEVRRVFMEGRL